jgi:hypothetical protein
MLTRIVFSLCCVAAVASACDCIHLPVQQAKREADIVFQGTVVALHNFDGRTPTAVFKVSRVWKGKITETFEMLAFNDPNS